MNYCLAHTETTPQSSKKENDCSGGLGLVPIFLSWPINTPRESGDCRLGSVSCPSHPDHLTASSNSRKASLPRDASQPRNLVSGGKASEWDISRDTAGPLSTLGAQQKQASEWDISQDTESSRNGRPTCASFGRSEWRKAVSGQEGLGGGSCLPHVCQSHGRQRSLGAGSWRLGREKPQPRRWRMT